MKKLIKSSLNLTDLETIRVTMYLHPDIYSDLERVVADATYNPRENKYYTDINPARTINGPLSEYGQQLENPIKDEYEGFVRDCEWLVKELGFTIITTERSLDSEKSEYIIMFGLDGSPCGTLIYDLRISDHPFDVSFPDRLKDVALEYLKMNKIIDGTAEKAGIDFTVEKVTVGSVRNDTWQKAMDRLYNKLRNIRRTIRHRLNERNN